MHFWIDKRAGGGFYGRRSALPVFFTRPGTCPSSAGLHAAAAAAANRRRTINNYRKPSILFDQSTTTSSAGPMVTPVHRFQPIESIREELLQNSGSSNGHRRSSGTFRSASDRRRRSRSRDRETRRELVRRTITNTSAAADATWPTTTPQESTDQYRLIPNANHGRGATASRDVSPVVYNPTDPAVLSRNGLNAVTVPQNSAANGNGFSPETSVYLSLPSDDGATTTSSVPLSPRYAYSPGIGMRIASPDRCMAYLAIGHLKCVMWACFAFVTVIMASAKFYLDRYGTGFELLGLGFVLLLFLLIGCMVSFFRLKTRRYLVSRVSGSDREGTSTSSTVANPYHPNHQQQMQQQQRLLLIPPSTTNRLYRPQRLTLRPVRVSRSQPNMHDNNNGQPIQQQTQQQQQRTTAATTAPSSSRVRRSQSTYSSEHTVGSPSPTNDWANEGLGMQSSSSELVGGGGGGIGGSVCGAPPPPYHVAILLPPPCSPDLSDLIGHRAITETPPPSYEKAIS